MSWELDKAHSDIQFSVRHMMISTVKGRFESFDGTFDINEANPTASSVTFEIDVASINTREAQRDGHLKSADFFDVENHPKMSFKSRSVEQLDASNLRITGDLTIKAVTKEVVLDVEYAGQAKSPWGTTSAGFTASTKINRKDWGLTWNQALETGGVLVGEEVKINIEAELVKQEQPAAENAG